MTYNASISYVGRKAKMEISTLFDAIEDDATNFVAINIPRCLTEL